MTHAIAFELPDAENVARQIECWRDEHGDFAVLLETLGDPANALRQFGTFCRNNRDYGQAIEATRAALALTPMHVVLWRELASMYQVTEQDALAEACAREYLGFDPDHAITWLQYASLAFKLGHIAQSEAAYLRALALDPALGDASLGLGLLYLGSRKFDDAISYLQRSLSLGGTDGVTYLCLGQALYMAGRFSECADAFEQAAEHAPLHGITLRLYARARTFAAMVDGDIEPAMARYPALAGAEAETADEILRAAFSLFSAYGMHDAAVGVGRLRLATNPADPVQSYLLDAVAGKTHDRAPANYVETHFDEFAEGFDSKLVDVLGYRVPSDLAELLATRRTGFPQILDLGCGTGLAAAPLQRFGGHLTGVDLSEKMLAAARQRNAYTSLAKSDAIDFLQAMPQAFDLIFAADLLIYFGKLDTLVHAIASTLTPGGLFAASIELAAHGDFALLPSGRFAHGEAYVEAMVARHFDIVRKAPSELRLEAGFPVPGLLYVMQLRGSY